MSENKSMRHLRITALTFGVLSYLVFLATFLYSIGFVGNLVVLKSIDSGTQQSIAEAVTVGGYSNRCQSSFSKP